MDELAERVKNALEVWDVQLTYGMRELLRDVLTEISNKDG